MQTHGRHLNRRRPFVFIKPLDSIKFAVIISMKGYVAFGDRPALMKSELMEKFMEANF